MHFDFNKFMQRKGLKQQEAADLVGVSQATISNWCKGKTPDMGMIEKLIGFGITAQEIFGDELGDQLFRNSAVGTVPPLGVYSNPQFRESLEELMVDILKKKGVL